METWWKWGGVVAVVVSTACSDVATPNEMPIDAGDAGRTPFPPLPADCDLMPPSASMGVGPSEFARPGARIRAVGDTVYLLRTRGVHAVKVPGGTPALAVPYPIATLPDGTERVLGFRDFWIDESTLFGVFSGAFYRAATMGGSATLLPGHSAPSPSAENRAFYVREGETVYRTTFFPPAAYGIERYSLSGGMPSELLRFNAPIVRRPVVGDGWLYYVDRAEGEAEGTASIFALSLDTGASTAIARGFQSPSLLGFDGNLYVTDSPSAAGFGQLFRIRADHRLEKLTTPYNVILPLEISFAGFKGSGYFTAGAYYHHPDNRRGDSRDVVMRIRPDSDTVEMVRCLPNSSAGPPVPTPVSSFVIDLTAGDSALYLARALVDPSNDTWEDQILEVAR